MRKLADVLDQAAVDMPMVAGDALQQNAAVREVSLLVLACSMIEP